MNAKLKEFLTESRQLADCQHLAIGNETMELFSETITIIKELVCKAEIEKKSDQSKNLVDESFYLWDEVFDKVFDKKKKKSLQIYLWFFKRFWVFGLWMAINFLSYAEE